MASRSGCRPRVEAVSGVPGGAIPHVPWEIQVTEDRAEHTHGPESPGTAAELVVRSAVKVRHTAVGGGRMRPGIRRAAQLVCWAFLALLPLALACTKSPPPEKPEPAGKADTVMFSEAEAYERFMGRWSRRLAPPFIKFAGLKHGARVLDVGSGTGSLTLAVLQEAPASRVVGVDPSAVYVAHARTRADAGRATFEEGDAQRLRFPDASFDATLALLVVNFIPDRVAAVREMARVTRPGGVVAAAVWDYGDGMEMLRAFWDEAVALDPAGEKKDERHMPVWRTGELAG